MEWIHLYNFKEVLFSSAEVNFGRYVGAIETAL